MRRACARAAPPRRRSPALRASPLMLARSSCAYAANLPRRNEPRPSCIIGELSRRDRRGDAWSAMKKSAFDIRSIIRPDLLELPGYVPITPSDVLAEQLGIAPEDVIKLD